MIEARKFLIKTEFMKYSFTMGDKVSDFLFRYDRDPEMRKKIDATFDEYMYRVVEEATEEEQLDFNIVLMFLEIESFSDWLKNKLITYVRMDQDVMEWGLYGTILDLFTEPAKFFGIIKAGRLL